jgi:hypothetical protein
MIGMEFLPDQVKANRKKVRDGIKQYWTFANFYGNVLEAVAHDLSQEFGINHFAARDLEPFFTEFWDRYQGRLRMAGSPDGGILEAWLGRNAGRPTPP